MNPAQVQLMDVDYPNELDIVDASKARLLNGPFDYSGISVDMYQFSHDPTKDWSNGHVFTANSMQDISFEGMIDTPHSSNKRDAVFLVHEADKRQNVEEMLRRSLSLKHTGILKPSVAGYNTQISKVVSGYSVPTHSVSTRNFNDWLHDRIQMPRPTTISPEVQELIRTAYQAIEAMWLGGYTSDLLADPHSYHMFENKIKIDPLCIRDKKQGENDKMPIRRAFADMIKVHIYPVWNDVELLDFVDLLKNRIAGSPSDIMGAPVLLLPASRELIYFNYDKATLPMWKQNWLNLYASPRVGWKNYASSADPALKTIIDFQAQRDQPAGVGFSPNFKGALHFASVVTSHYQQHFKDTPEGQWGVAVKDRVDSLLKQVLPGMLSKLYNSEYLQQPARRHVQQPARRR